MNGQQIKISQTQTADKKFGPYNDMGAALSNKALVITSDAEVRSGLDQKIDRTVSTLSAYKADVTLYLALANGPSFRED